MRRTFLHRRKKKMCRNITPTKILLDQLCWERNISGFQIHKYWEVLLMCDTQSLWFGRSKVINITNLIKHTLSLTVGIETTTTWLQTGRSSDWARTVIIPISSFTYSNGLHYTQNLRIPVHGMVLVLLVGYIESNMPTYKTNHSWMKF